MKRVGRAGSSGAFWATLDWGGASGGGAPGVAGVWAKVVAAGITRSKLRRVRRGKRLRMGDRVALM